MWTERSTSFADWLALHRQSNQRSAYISQQFAVCCAGEGRFTLIQVNLIPLDTTHLFPETIESLLSIEELTCIDTLTASTGTAIDLNEDIMNVDIPNLERMQILRDAIH